jgi:hypothetical protein
MHRADGPVGRVGSRRSNQPGAGLWLTLGIQRRADDTALNSARPTKQPHIANAIQLNERTS